MENNKKLTRSRKERMIAGVCGGFKSGKTRRAA